MVDAKVMSDKKEFQASREHIQSLESKLSRMKYGKKQCSAASMIATIKMVKEDSTRILIDGESSIDQGRSEEQLTFMDKMYVKSPVYRHAFPDTQSLGTDEKAFLIENDHLQRLNEDDASSP